MALEVSPTNIVYTIVPMDETSVIVEELCLFSSICPICKNFGLIYTHFSSDLNISMTPHTLNGPRTVSNMYHPREPL